MHASSGYSMPLFFSLSLFCMSLPSPLCFCACVSLHRCNMSNSFRPLRDVPQSFCGENIVQAWNIDSETLTRVLTNREDRPSIDSSYSCLTRWPTKANPRTRPSHAVRSTHHLLVSRRSHRLHHFELERRRQHIEVQAHHGP